jgi:hypothetical protein
MQVQNDFEFEPHGASIDQGSTCKQGLTGFFLGWTSSGSNAVGRISFSQDSGIEVHTVRTNNNRWLEVGMNIKFDLKEIKPDRGWSSKVSQTLQLNRNVVAVNVVRNPDAPKFFIRNAQASEVMQLVDGGNPRVCISTDRPYDGTSPPMILRTNSSLWGTVVMREVKGTFFEFIRNAAGSVLYPQPHLFKSICNNLNCFLFLGS